MPAAAAAGAAGVADAQHAAADRADHRHDAVDRSSIHAPGPRIAIDGSVRKQFDGERARKPRSAGRS